MTAISAAPQPLALAPARTSSVLFLLRFEGLAMAAFSVFFYASTGASWWLFAALFLVPHLSMLGYLGGACWGARIYNAIHTYVTPATLALCALLLHAHLALVIALIWTSHIGVDRLLGYGLKYADGFGYTHLGRIGKHEA
ncbi:MAG TPA: DUF4260 domain-containing protein [Terracidiphilus sp.]|nr:DUF4260 domain-containing protein [Terracidiphilus sp.]